MKNKAGIKYLNYNDLTRRNFTELPDIWRSNHKILLENLLDKHPRYFGLHGTSKPGLESIEREKSGYINVATFFDKEQTEEQLFKLYSMCLYTTAYAFRERGNKPNGGIMVFDFEKDNKNIILPWEHLSPGVGIAHSLVFDTDAERENFHLLDRRENLHWRSDVYLNQQKIEKHYKGAILAEEADSFIKELPKNSEIFSRHIMRDRFFAQYILNESLKKIEHY